MVDQAERLTLREAAVAAAREEIEKRRTRIREIEETVTGYSQWSELLNEHWRLRREIEAYSRVVDSKGRKKYRDPDYPAGCVG